MKKKIKIAVCGYLKIFYLHKKVYNINMTCVTLELKSQEKKEIEYEQQKKSLMEDIHFNIIFKCIYIRRRLRDREPDEEEICR